MPDVIWRGFSSTFFLILAKESLNLGYKNNSRQPGLSSLGKEMIAANIIQRIPRSLR
jgi:hypothetical protein